MGNNKRLLTHEDLLDYEIHASWWAKQVWWHWGQGLTGKWFAWKVTRKFARYKASKVNQALVKAWRTLDT